MKILQTSQKKIRNDEKISRDIKSRESNKTVFVLLYINIFTYLNDFVGKLKFMPEKTYNP